MSKEIRTKRRYQLKKRADSMAETRRRIAAAAAELHGTIGPARTTMSAVAELARVQRHTLYRHFPTEADLFGACSAHFFAEHPFPEPGPWSKIDDPNLRLRKALDDLYAYYERTEPMFTNVLRDAGLIEALRPTLVPLQHALDDLAELLASGWNVEGRQRRLLGAATRHVIDFHTWKSLTANCQLGRNDTIQLAVGLVESAVTSPSTRNS